MSTDGIQHDTARLDAAIARSKRGGLGKLLAAPGRMGASKILEWRCGGASKTIDSTATTFWGEPMHVVFPDPISMSIYRYGYFEADLTRIFLEVLKPGMIFFDVGSHFGFFSLLALHLVGPAGRAVAFEPTPSTRRVLERNIASRPNARVIPMAVYRESATLTFHDFGVRNSGYNSLYGGKLTAQDRQSARDTAFQVQATTIDSFVESSGITPDFLKIDTEGAEPDVLAGMDRLLTGRSGKPRPALTLEVGDLGGSDIRPSREVVNIILAKGYRGLELREGRLVEHLPRDRYEYENLLFVPS